MAHVVTGCFESLEGRTILTVRRFWAISVFIELSERVLSLPLQEHWATLVPLDLAKLDLSRGSVAATGGNLSLDQQGVELVEPVTTLPCDVESLPSIFARLL